MMRWRPMLLMTAFLLLIGCNTVSRSGPQPTQKAQKPAPVGPSLEDRVQQVKNADRAMDQSRDKVPYKHAWDEFLPAVDTVLNHPQAWSLAPDALPLMVAVNEPDYRVFFKNGDYQYLGEDPTLNNFWVQWRDKAGVTHAQVLYRARGHLDHQARAYGSLLLFLADGDGAHLEAWRLQGSAWERVNDGLSPIGHAIGDMAVVRTAEDMIFMKGWWRSFSVDGSRREYGPKGVPYLCPNLDSPSLRCYKLQVQQGQISFVPPDANQVAHLSDPAVIKGNLSIGYFDNGKQSAEPSISIEAAARAQDGLEAYLKLPLSHQLAPAAFQEFFKDTAPGYVRLLDLAPNMRVYSMFTRPEYQPRATAWVEWWSDPAKPLVQELEMDMFDGLWDAALLGTEQDSVLVYTYGTFPTRHETGRGAVTLRLDAAQQSWVGDTRAFPANIPKEVGEVALFRWPTGTGLGINRPNDPPISNKVELDAERQSLTICDTDILCLTLHYKDHQFFVQPL
jgi:hypothetical protein